MQVLLSNDAEQLSNLASSFDFNRLSIALDYYFKSFYVVNETDLFDTYFYLNSNRSQLYYYSDSYDEYFLNQNAADLIADSLDFAGRKEIFQTFVYT